jgi:hypothetical protein
VQSLKRILAAIVMVICALVLALSLTGIVGAWVVRAQLATDLMGFSTKAEARATRAKQGVDRLDAALTRAHDQVLGLEHEVQAFGADLEQNRPLLSAISERLGLELGPLFDSLREIVTTIREAITAVDSAIEAINAIPFISIPVLEMEKLAKLSQAGLLVLGWRFFSGQDLLAQEAQQAPAVPDRTQSTV